MQHYPINNAFWRISNIADGTSLLSFYFFKLIKTALFTIPLSNSASKRHERQEEFYCVCHMDGTKETSLSYPPPKGHELHPRSVSNPILSLTHVPDYPLMLKSHHSCPSSLAWLVLVVWIRWICRWQGSHGFAADKLQKWSRCSNDRWSALIELLEDGCIWILSLPNLASVHHNWEESIKNI